VDGDLDHVTAGFEDGMLEALLDESPKPHR
jgi:hypothetical protein